MMVLRFILPTLLIVLCCSALRIKNVKDEVKTVLSKMEDYYEGVDNFSLEITYQAKQESGSGKLLEVTNGVYHQYKTGMYYFEINDIITIVRDEIMLVVDNNTKKILLTDNNNDLNSPLNLSMDESLELCSSIFHKDNTISFFYGKGSLSPYYKTSLSYDPKNYSLRSLTLHPKQLYSIKKSEREYIEVKTVLEVDYREYNQQQVTKDKLSLSPFVKKSNENYTLDDDYSNYELINQLK